MVTVPVKTVNSAQNLKCLTLRQLLDCCSSPSSPQWEIAWHILISRFEGFIYNKAYSRCLNWHIPRLCRQFSEVVNDVNGEVLYKLCKNQCKALQDFRKRDSERAFLSWLGKICDNACDNIIAKEFKNSLMENNIQDIYEAIGGTHMDTSWELREDIERILHLSETSKMKNRKRDITIFTLFVWGGFSAKMIQKHLALEKLGHRVVNNIVHRMKGELRANSAWLR